MQRLVLVTLTITAARQQFNQACWAEPQPAVTMPAAASVAAPASARRQGSGCPAARHVEDGGLAQRAPAESDSFRSQQPCPGQWWRERVLVLVSNTGV